MDRKSLNSKLNQHFSGKRVFITGGHGFVGKHLRPRLKELGATVVSPTKMQCNLARVEEITAQLKSAQPDIVLHLAAYYGGLEFTLREPGRIYYENLIQGAHLLEAAQTASVPKVVTVGTSCSYPAHLQCHLKESELWAGDMDSQIEAYGYSKKMSVVQAKAYRQQFGLNAIQVIPAQLYGPYDHTSDEKSHVVSAVIKKFLQATQTNEPVHISGTGKPVRDFIYVTDFVEGLLHTAASYDQAMPLNIGTGQGISIGELAANVAGLVGYKGQILFDSSRPEGQPMRVLDTTRMKKHLEWAPSVSLDAGLRKTVDWFLETQGLDLTPSSDTGIQKTIDLF